VRQFHALRTLVTIGSLTEALSCCPMSKEGTRTRLSQEPTNPLNKLLSMPLAERISVVAKDVRTRRDEFRDINPHDLAEALGVPDSGQPTSGDWFFTHYAEKQTLEEYGENFSELAHLMEGVVSPKRFQALVEKSINDESDDGFDFLTIKERRGLENAISQQSLESNIENGICCVAHHEISASRPKLRFEAYIEDDGACIDLLTPYDHRDGRFKNLNDCVTKSSW
jgi:hypothetical protein